MAVRVGQLIVDLQARTGSFIKSMDKAHQVSFRNSKQIQKSLLKIGGAIAAAGTAFAAAAAVMIKKSIDAADAFAKMSRATGVSVEDLSQLQHVMKLSGIETEQFQKSLTKLNQSVFDAGRGLKTQVVAFEEFGITQKELNDLSGDTIGMMMRLADGFAAAENKSRALAAIGQLLGQRVGPQLANAFAQGSEGIRDMMREADALGLTISTKTAVAAEQFNDNLTRMQSHLTALGLKLSQETLPTLNRLLVTVVATSRMGFPSLTDGIKDAASGMLILQGRYNPMLKIIPGLSNKLEDLGTKWALNDDRLQSLTDVMVEFNEAFDAAVAAMARGITNTTKASEKTKDWQKDAKKLTQEILDQTSAMRVWSSVMEDAAGPQLSIWEQYEREFGEGIRRQTEALKKQNEERFEAQLAGSKAVTDAGRKEGIQLRATQAETAKLESRMQELSHTVGTAFEDAILGGKDYRRVLQGIFEDLGRITIRVLTQPLKDIFARTVGGLLGKLPIPGRQFGGPVSAGRPYVVGERGPELFIPKQAGTVVSKAGAITVNNYVDARGGAPGTDRMVARALRELHTSAIKKSIEAFRDQASRVG
jgi:hypothetical protein